MKTCFKNLCIYYYLLPFVGSHHQFYHLKRKYNTAEFRQGSQEQWGMETDVCPLLQKIINFIKKRIQMPQKRISS